MDNFDEVKEFAEAYVGPVRGELYCRLLKIDYSQDDPEVAMLTAALTNNIGHDNRDLERWRSADERNDERSERNKRQAGQN